MSEHMQAALDSAAASAPAWLEDVLQNGRTQWQSETLPTRKTEAWKYTSLHPLQQTFAAAPQDAADVNANEIPDFSDSRLVFVDGQYQAQLSTEYASDSGVRITRFTDASDADAARIKEHLGKAVDANKHVFAKLNNAALSEGLFVDVAANAVLEKPIHLVWISSGEKPAYSVNQRLLVLAGTNSQATVIEHFINHNDSSSAFTNGISELVLEHGAILEYYRLNLEHAAALHVAGIHCHLADSACLRSFFATTGSKLKRLDVVVHHAGSGAHCEMNGIYLPQGSEHIDVHTCIEHAVPHCTTDENFRGIVADQASAVFNGRIHIHPDAQQTRAELSNRNLLTSNEAEINTKPELEIYADDVQCAHGATVAQLDETSMHYLRSRGVSRAEAEVMLSFGFINELVDGIRLDALRDYLRPFLASRFAGGTELARHLT
ncbi:MAG: Fe-S cluster assembly protein SufD [Pseudomonadales bacterium]